MKMPFMILLLVLTLSINGCVEERDVKDGQVCFDGSCFSVEIPIESDDFSRGLMFRDHLDADSGMLFIFDKEGVHSFWMKNTRISLDIIWINEEKEIVFIKTNAQPCKAAICPSINPGKNARYVLEINGGIADNISLRVGDKAIIRY